MKAPQTVLVGTSLGPRSDEIVRAGAAAARALDAELHLVHAFKPPPWYGEPQVEAWSELRTDVRPIADDLERDLATQLERLDIPPRAVASRHVRIGPPHRVLDELGRSLRATLVVVGAADAEHPRGPVFGTTADRLVRRTTRPVLVVRPPLSVPPARVLAPVDLSPISADALASGLGVVRRLAGGTLPELEMLFVLHPDEKDISAQFSAEQIERFSGEELHRFALRAGVSALEKVREGDPRDEIPLEVAEWKPDLVVVGTHGRSGFERLLLGSVATYVTRHSTTSVLVIPPEAALRASLSEDDRELSRRPARTLPESHPLP